MHDQAHINSVEIENTNKLKSFSDKRKERARLLLEKSTPQELNEFTYLVPSQTNPEKKYIVTYIDTYSCECEDYNQRCKGRGIYCKHIQAVLLLEKLKTAVSSQPVIQLTKPEREQDICPYCFSEQIFKRGKRKTTTEIKQLYCCKECKRRFVLEPIKYIKTNAQMVTLAMDLYFKGNSLRDIADTFKQFYNIDLSHETIRNWVRKFSKVMNEYSKKLQPQTSGIWNADETLTRTKKGKMDYEYVWNVMDKGTKFLLASKTSGHERNIENAKAIMKEAWQQNKKIPYQIITDRNPSYQEGIRKTFKNWGEHRRVKHTSIVGKRRVINNNEIENLNGLQKEFHKVRKGVNEIQDYNDGFKVFHNFIRKGVEDKKTPAERCNVGIKDNNRWMGLLTKSMKATNLTREQEIMKSHVD